jgi:hypothetical protein
MLVRRNSSLFWGSDPRPVDIPLQRDSFGFESEPTQGFARPSAIYWDSLIRFALQMWNKIFTSERALGNKDGLGFHVGLAL